MTKTVSSLWLLDWTLLRHYFYFSDPTAGYTDGMNKQRCYLEAERLLGPRYFKKYNLDCLNLSEFNLELVRIVNEYDHVISRYVVFSCLLGYLKQENWKQYIVNRLSRHRSTHTNMVWEMLWNVNDFDLRNEKMALLMRKSVMTSFKSDITLKYRLDLRIYPSSSRKDLKNKDTAGDIESHYDIFIYKLIKNKFSIFSVDS